MHTNVPPQTVSEIATVLPAADTQHAVKRSAPEHLSPVAVAARERCRAIDLRWRKKAAIMNRVEMLAVESVRGIHEPRAVRLVAKDAARDVIVLLLAEEKRQRKQWLASIEKEHVAVAFDCRESPLPRKPRRIFDARRASAKAVETIAPVVIRADDRIALDVPAAKIRTHVRATRIHHGERAAFSSKRHELPTKHRLRHRPPSQLATLAEEIPGCRPLRKTVDGWRAIHWMTFPAKRFSTCSVAGCGPFHMLKYAATRLPRCSRGSPSSGRYSQGTVGCA